MHENYKLAKTISMIIKNKEMTPWEKLVATKHIGKNETTMNQIEFSREREDRSWNIYEKI